MAIQVFIADDHPLILQGMQTLLSRHQHILLTGAFSSGAGLLEGLARSVPDVLLLDIQMPDRTGDELAPVLLKDYPSLKILMLTNFDSTLYVHNMLRHGVHGYLLKTSEEESLIHAIEVVHGGGVYIDPVLRDKMEQIPEKTKRIHTTKSNLTSRETEILQLIVDGYTDPEIAQQLYLSLNTVKHYRISILLKLDVKNTAALVNKALKLGLAV
jgi:DNA-binding NarL/FixJ family response regulator